MSFRKFLTTRVFFRQLLRSIGISLLLIFIILLMLRFYTRHGQALEVPDLYGMAESEYEDALDNADLKYEVMDSTYSTEVAPGCVVDQVPNAGHKVKRKRTIYLTINAKAPERVALPRLTDISYRQALVQLETVGLMPGQITFSPSEFQNLVLKARLDGQEIFEGEIITKGTRIDLEVGSGKGLGTTSLPNVTGLSLNDARSRIYGVGLNIGSLIYDNSIISGQDSLSARVWQQSPDPSVTIDVSSGTAIDLWISIDPSRFVNLEKKTEEEEFHF